MQDRNTLSDEIIFLINITETHRERKKGQARQRQSECECKRVCVCDHGDGTVDPLCSGTKTTIC